MAADRSKQEARRQWMLDQQAKGFPAARRSRDWRDVAKCSFCGANGHEVEKLIAGGGKVASGHPVMICDRCVDLCADIVAEYRSGKT
jgi:hypothetical protein